jgi:hypothetical protein
MKLTIQTIETNNGKIHLFKDDEINKYVVEYSPKNAKAATIKFSSLEDALGTLSQFVETSDLVKG